MNGFLWLVAVLVVFGIAAVAYFVYRSRMPAPPVPTAPRAPDADDIRRELADLLGTMVGKVSPDILSKYESIHRRMLTMLPRVGQLPGTSQDLYILHRTASDYLPTAVRSYLVLARSGVTEQPLDDGSTPRQALMAQLDLIETRLVDIGEALDRNDLDRLLIHGRFLEAQFRRRTWSSGPGSAQARDRHLPPVTP